MNRPWSVGLDDTAQNPTLVATSASHHHKPTPAERIRPSHTRTFEQNQSVNLNQPKQLVVLTRRSVIQTAVQLAFSDGSMRCSNCGNENPAGSRFCNRCGTPLGKTCPKCAAENARDAKFCSQCGASLEPLPERHAESQPRERGLTGERRHLTILFCDLVGSTEIAASTTLSKLEFW